MVVDRLDSLAKRGGNEIFRAHRVIVASIHRTSLNPNRSSEARDAIQEATSMAGALVDLTIMLLISAGEIWSNKVGSGLTGIRRDEVLVEV